MVTSRNDFDRALQGRGLELRRSAPEVLQLNVGKLCNLTCVHCHVNAGPRRKEIISSDTVDRVLEWFERSDISTIDLTGGSPEMAPDFRRIVESVRGFARPRRVMDRLNATILNERGYEWVAEFLAAHEVAIIASMPCYSPENVDEQRGDGVFDSSIRAFQELNRLGYGRDPRLPLNLVYNPNGASLPGDQQELESDYKRELKAHFGIEFNELYCLANMPIARFASYLKRTGQFADYLVTLKDAFNPATVPHLMCRNTISVSWTGDVYDCDFNQMLGIHLRGDDLGTANGSSRNGARRRLKLWDVAPKSFRGIPIRTGVHCFGCTAGAGSSCGGQLA